MKRLIILISVFWIICMVQPINVLAQEIDLGRYEASVHGTVECISCHNQETDGLSGKKLAAAISENCVNCHTGAGFDYQRSVHFESEWGPNCVTCHEDHYILPVNNKSSPVYPSNISQTCGDCHKKEQVSFEESFHGKAVSLGSNSAPDCTYCHESHDVLGGDNPVAMTSLEGKSMLCGECHEGDALGAQFTEHYQLTAKGPGAPMYWVKKVFMWLILIVVGFFLIHIEMDLWHKLRLRKV